MRFLLMMIGMLMIVASCTSSRKENTNNDETSEFQEKWRPQIHFTPEQNWMNDPNGMVYYNEEYHLFYQHNPDTTVWGPMHWGHAVSKDLIHWEHLPIALYPDSLGTIFSGSAVVDMNNTTNFSEGDTPPLVAVYTNHSHKKEREGRNDFQCQSIAYSLNNGREWKKFKNNPVLPNPGIRDFRDPKVIWYEPEEKWIMALAVKDRVSFYSSPNLKDWKYESDFGKGVDHGGVVECPDLFPLETENGEKKMGLTRERESGRSQWRIWN
ncbi:glycoside hydrolase family 32 protein [Anaerophaga thermohalophila]|uniref:glycoside hydrolase family 32 protein n=1 Tax=Anaerophaga thermohalophila TaxID=177400 RepID=UPI00031B537A|nr:glycoside hydrolase family 32 protein [Anaerophaga thermohalophila]